MSLDSFDVEEEFHRQDRKELRKLRKLASKLDRSKRKKSDEKAYPSPPEGDFLRGRVLAISSEGIIVFDGSNEHLCYLKGALKKERTDKKNLVTIGDFVLIEGESVVYVEERKSVLSRADNLSHRKEQLIAANIDQVFITAAVVEPSVKPPLIDRYIIAARKGNMAPIIVINKIDLVDQNPRYAEFKEAYSNLDIPFIEVSALKNQNLDILKHLMAHKTSVFSGQSGVGKTSLLNTMLNLSMKTGAVAIRTGKGTHATTSSHLIHLDNGGFCIDTPGIKSFGLWKLNKEDLVHYFSEIDAASKGCKFAHCTHLHEPDCAVIDAVENGVISIIRYESYLSLLTKED